ncbi:hypothetical protein [Pedobacter agri]|uniref:hypothetical protein n=1 Tax=Pedobacter agri TaxID=454586 RepID=UPI00293118A1|nr:hypothetical protein [Pedobacter agri]
MTGLSEQISALLENGKLNIEQRLELLQYRSLIFVSKLAANLVTNIIMSVCILLAFLFGTITLGFLFSDLFNSYTAGFGGLTIFYLIIATVVFSKRISFIEKMLINISIRKLMHKYFDDELKSKEL